MRKKKIRILEKITNKHISQQSLWRQKPGTTAGKRTLRTPILYSYFAYKSTSILVK